jgi:hypothetical protein
MTTLNINIHSAQRVQTFRDQHLLVWWIGRGGSQACLPRSLYLKHVEDKARKIKVETQNSLFRYIMEAPDRLK